MSISSDGATVRRERILDMLRYIRGFMPRGVTLQQVQLYMSLAHGLTGRTSQKYVYEMQQGGVMEFVAGSLKVNIPQFRRLMEIMAPDRNPDTGEFLASMGFSLDDIPLQRAKKREQKKPEEVPAEEEEELEEEYDEWDYEVK